MQSSVHCTIMYCTSQYNRTKCNAMQKKKRDIYTAFSPNAFLRHSVGKNNALCLYRAHLCSFPLEHHDCQYNIVVALCSFRWALCVWLHHPFPHLNSHRYTEKQSRHKLRHCLFHANLSCRKELVDYVSQNHEVQGIKVIVKLTIAIFLLCLAV